MNENISIGTMPILALRGLVVFPEQTVHFEVGRVKSVLALEEAMKRDQTLLLMPQKDISKDDPELKDLYAMGTVAKVKQILRGTGETIRVLVTGLYRARIQELTQNEPYLFGVVASVPPTELMDNLNARALRREANTLYGGYLEITEHQAQPVQLKMLASNDCGFLADSIAQNSSIEFVDKMKLLLQMNPVRRLEMAVKMLRQEMEMVRLENSIHEKTKFNIDQQQRDYYLREQMRAIRDELGEEEDNEFAQLEKQILLLNLNA